MKMIMIAALVILPTGALTACSPTGAQVTYRAPEADLRAASRPFIACVYRAAQSLDDHASPATDIAEGAEAQCSAEWGNMIDVYDSRMSPYEKSVFLQAQLQSDDETKIATGIVLDERRGALK